MKFLSLSSGLVLAICTALSSSVLAESQRSRQYINCMESVDLGGFKNSQWADCMTAELQRQDVELNIQYRNLRSSLSTEERNALTQAQRTWLKFREQWCRFEEQSPIAPGGTVNYLSCLLRLTDQQIEAIEGARY